MAPPRTPRRKRKSLWKRIRRLRPLGSRRKARGDNDESLLGSPVSVVDGFSFHLPPPADNVSNRSPGHGMQHISQAPSTVGDFYEMLVSETEGPRATFDAQQFDAGESSAACQDAIYHPVVSKNRDQEDLKRNESVEDAVPSVEMGSLENSLSATASTPFPSLIDCNNMSTGGPSLPPSPFNQQDVRMNEVTREATQSVHNDQAVSHDAAAPPTLIDEQTVSLETPMRASSPAILHDVNMNETRRDDEESDANETVSFGNKDAAATDAASPELVPKTRGFPGELPSLPSPIYLQDSRMHEVTVEEDSSDAIEPAGIFIEQKGDKALNPENVAMTSNSRAEGLVAPQNQNHEAQSQPNAMAATASSPNNQRDESAVKLEASFFREERMSTAGVASSTSLQVGNAVIMSGGSYKGDNGVITKITAKRVKVFIEGKGEKVLHPENIALTMQGSTNESQDDPQDSVLEARSAPRKTYPSAMATPVVARAPPNEPSGNVERDRSPTSDSIDEPPSLKAGKSVVIVGGNHKGDNGIVTKITAKRVKVFIEGKGEKTLNPENVSLIKVNGSKDSVPEARSTPQKTKLAPTFASAPALEQEQAMISPHAGSAEAAGQLATDNAVESPPRVSRTGLQSADKHEAAQMRPEKILIKSDMHKATELQISENGKSAGEKHSKPKHGSEGDANNRQKDNVGSQSKPHTQFPLSPTVNSVDTDGTDKRSEDGPHESCRREAELAIGDNVLVTNGGQDGKSGAVTKVTPKMVCVSIPGVGNKRVKKANVVRVGNSTTMPSAPSNGSEWRVADSSKGGTQFGTRQIIKLRLARCGYKKEDTFLAHLLQNRMKVVDIPLNKEEIAEEFDVIVDDNDGSQHELVSAKVQKDGDEGSGVYHSPECVRLVYAQVSGPGLKTISLRDELQRIADFASLSSRKLKARLELLQSPAYKFKSTKKLGIFFLQASDFCEIPEQGNVGCGFISEEMLLKLCGDNAEARRALAIQVRLFIPKMGVFKGVLFRKRIPCGQPPIQLPSSMRKVGPSPTPDDRAFLLINKFHPFTTNQHVNRLLNDNLKDPPSSFKIKAFKDMIPRLWRGLGVPQEIIDDYVKKSTRRINLNHAFVVGVADPTGKLPVGHIFVPGQPGFQGKLFVTRSPCVKAEDGRVLPTVTSKPEDMPSEDWEWLNHLPFGVIIFANPREGMKPLPEMIANGDLDGDLYFTCWNKPILSTIKAEPIEEVPVDAAPEDALPAIGDISNDEDWLKEGQKFMVDAVAMQEVGSLVGKLYTLSKKAADGNPDLFMRDPDAEAFAHAYNQALEFGKHGGKIRLPLHLHDQLPSKLREYVVA